MSVIERIRNAVLRTSAFQIMLQEFFNYYPQTVLFWKDNRSVQKVWRACGGDINLFRVFIQSTLYVEAVPGGCTLSEDVLFLLFDSITELKDTLPTDNKSAMTRNCLISMLGEIRVVFVRRFPINRERCFNGYGLLSSFLGKHPDTLLRRKLLEYAALENASFEDQDRAEALDGLLKRILHLLAMSNRHDWYVDIGYALTWYLYAHLSDKALIHELVNQVIEVVSCKPHVSQMMVLAMNQGAIMALSKTVTEFRSKEQSI